MLGLFQKNSGEFNFCKPETTDNPLNTTGIINDIDCGPKFFPQKMLNDSVMVMAIEANDLLDHIATLIDMPHVFTKVLNPTGSEIYIFIQITTFALTIIEAGTVRRHILITPGLQPGVPD